MMTLAVDAGTLEEVLDQARERLLDGDFSVVFAVVEADLEEAEAEAFAAERSPGGTPWADRKDSKPHPLLRETGRLWGSVAASDPPYAVRDQIDNGDTKVLFFGTSAPYAGYLQHGTRRMPARPFLGWAPEVVARAEELVADRAAQLVVGAVGIE